MRRQQRFPVLVVAAMLAAVVALPGCATESNADYQDGGRGGKGGMGGFQ